MTDSRYPAADTKGDVYRRGLAEVAFVQSVALASIASIVKDKAELTGADIERIEMLATGKTQRCPSKTH